MHWQSINNLGMNTWSLSLLQRLPFLLNIIPFLLFSSHGKRRSIRTRRRLGRKQTNKALLNLSPNSQGRASERASLGASKDRIKIADEGREGTNVHRKLNSPKNLSSWKAAMIFEPAIHRNMENWVKVRERVTEQVLSRKTTNVSELS